jgi:hypothetical protein
MRLRGIRAVAAAVENEAEQQCQPAAPVYYTLAGIAAPLRTHSQHGFFYFPRSSRRHRFQPQKGQIFNGKRAPPAEEKCAGNFGVVTFAKCEQNREHALWLEKH